MRNKSFSCKNKYFTIIYKVNQRACYITLVLEMNVWNCDQLKMIKEYFFTNMEESVIWLITLSHFCERYTPTV